MRLLGWKICVGVVVLPYPGDALMQQPRWVKCETGMCTVSTQHSTPTTKQPIRFYWYYQLLGVWFVFDSWTPSSMHPSRPFYLPQPVLFWASYEKIGLVAHQQSAPFGIPVLIPPNPLVTSYLDAILRCTEIMGPQESTRLSRIPSIAFLLLTPRWIYFLVQLSSDHSQLPRIDVSRFVPPAHTTLAYLSKMHM